MLRVLTINAWSGLDYIGIWRFGEYESAERRERRFRSLVSQIEGLDPDVVFVQEANPVDRYAPWLANTLGFDEIHQVTNAGVKLGSIGLPGNLKEGLAILARPALGLEKHDVWKLSGPPGVFGGTLAVQFGEAVFSLVGRIIVEDEPVYLVDVHLVASPPRDPNWGGTPGEARGDPSMTDSEYRRGVKRWLRRVRRREREAGRLIKRLKGLPPDSPVIIAGDFNAAPDAPEMNAVCSAGFLDTHLFAESGRSVTFDHTTNENARYSSRMTDARGAPRDAYGRLGALTGAQSRRTDYVFLSSHFLPGDVTDARVVLDEPCDGVHPSDHFGVLAEVDVTRVLAAKRVDDH